VLLHTVIVPPARILEPVAEVVRAAALAASPEELSPRRGFLRRGAGRENGTARRSDEAAAAAASEQLQFLEPTAMSLPIAGFGNVTSADAIRLADALQSAASGTPGATVRIAGGTALEFSEDRNVWARLEGDVDGLRSMARGVTQVVEQHGFFVDRRRFRPMLCVGTVTAATTAHFLETVVAALEDFNGESWVVDQVWLLKAFYGNHSTGFEVVDRFPLAPVAVTS
jgi:2'-5' RNA ligase